LLAAAVVSNKQECGLDLDVSVSRPYVSHLGLGLEGLVHIPE